MPFVPDPPSKGQFVPDEPGFLENAYENAKRALNPLNIVKGSMGDVKEGAFDLPIDVHNTLAQLVGETVTGKDAGPTPMGERTAAIANSDEVQDPANWAYKNPIDAALQVGAIASMAAPMIAGPAETLGKYAGRFGENQMGKLHGASPAQFKQMGRDYFGDAMRSSYKMGDADFGLGSIGREQMIKERINQMGQELGDIRAEANAAGPQMTPSQMQKAIQEHVSAKFAPGGKYFDEASSFNKNLQNIGRMPEGGIENFAERVTDLRDQAKTNSMRLPVNAETEIAKEMAAVNDAQIVKRLPEKAEQYGMLKDEFRNAKSLDPMELRLEGKESLGAGSHTAFGMAKDIAHTLVGGPKLGAHLGFGAEGLLNTISQNAGLAPWGALFQQAAQRGPQAVISNHFILMQKDPEYNKAFAEGMNETSPFGQNRVPMMHNDAEYQKPYLKVPMQQ